MDYCFIIPYTVPDSENSKIQYIIHPLKGPQQKALSTGYKVEIMGAEGFQVLLGSSLFNFY